MSNKIEAAKVITGKFQAITERKQKLAELQAQIDEQQAQLNEVQQYSQSDLMLLVQALDSPSIHNVTGGLLGVINIDLNRCYAGSEALNAYANAVDNYNRAFEKLCRAKQDAIRNIATTGENMGLVSVKDMAVLKRLDRGLWLELQGKKLANKAEHMQRCAEIYNR